jgi:hypothetical protein
MHIVTNMSAILGLFTFTATLKPGERFVGLESWT